MPQSRSAKGSTGSGQLSLFVFAELLSDEIQNIVNPDTLGLDAAASSTDVLKQPDPDPLDSIPAGDREILAKSQSTRDGGFRDASDVCGDAVPVNSDSEAELSGGVGDRESGMRAPRRNSIARISLSLATPHTGPGLARDFRISEAHGIGVGSLGTKLKHNLEAIQTLKELEAENRPASSEEQARLVRYCGWGALPQVFLPHPDPKWRPGADALQELLTPEEFESAKASTPNAHYTSAGVVRWIWDCLIRLGVCSGIQVLEPACGIGHFFGLMPECLLASSSRTGVELEPISARIAQKLYPGSLILAGAFERAALPDNFYDVVIGNVPFANVPVFDPIYRRQPALTRSLHDYFLVRSIDRARPNGLIALITSAYSMDKREQSVRKHIAHRATLIAAQRLPNTTFEQNAGTSVTTDLLIFQKL